MGEQQSKHDDSAEALRSMADGQDLGQPDEGEEHAIDPDIQADIAGELADAGGVEASDLQGLPEGPQATAVRRARAAAFEKQAGQASAQHFKRIMIPLLIAVGLLLIVLGALAAAVLHSADSVATGTMVAVVAAFPLGAFLLCGAWLFHRETKHLKKK